MSKQVPPDEFKLQVRIPLDLYQQMLDLTEYNGTRIYGGITKLIILALREYLSKYQTTVKAASDEEI